MATVTINNPAIIKITNSTEGLQTFAPYRENFTANLVAENSIEFSVDTAGQALYYLAQASDKLEVEQILAFSSATDGLLIIETPATITITNTSTSTKSFVPYRENFTVDIAGGDSVVLTVDRVGQVLYYLAQASDGLTVTQAEAQ